MSKIYVVDFDVPYDEWHTVKVTQDIEKAIDCIMSSEANSIKIWENENLTDEVYFAKRYDWDSDEEYIKNLNYEINNFRNKEELSV
ncbi:hypothetical protein [Peptostreptococcus porci]|uniref:hypothetical protein n=1 Tax=Peptostreptococcus porci TaxID=2652282 RepID=UPI002A82248C|nr:hypothetical protein [Peptostreptococcus porci]MDY4127712.1 hypothetical protein [Peptostreptococcus porci]